MRARLLSCLAAAALAASLAVACGDDGGGDGPPDAAAPDAVEPDASPSDTTAPSDTAAPDVPPDVPEDATPPPDGGAADGVSPDVVSPDVADDADAAAPVLPPLPTQAPLAAPPDPLADSDVQSCALYLEERCEGGRALRCTVYDPAAEDWVETVDPLLHRALLFDRWRDLYNSPDGQAIDRDFAVAVPPGTPEEEWSRPENFRCYCGSGDGGIWTGWATVAAILRYAETGTQADYERMEQQVRDLVTMYDVTGIPGYLCRYHYLRLPEGAPNDPEHILRWGEEIPNHHHRPVVDPASIDNLPAIYTEGVTDDEGTVWTGTPMWQGRPSIDQNTGPMTALPMAWDLLRDEALKDRIAHHLTCYLKRLQRVELRNLQSNPELLDGLIAYFSIGELQLDPDDLDLTKLDTIVGYVHRQVNTKNEATFDTSCPDTVQRDPWRVIDATSPTFLADLLALVADMDTDDERPNQIDHYYFPSIRGGDAMHLMHLATIAYHFTGDDQYRRFLHEELVGAIDTIRVAETAGAFDLPKFCKKYFGDQITYGPWWAFLHLLGDGELRTALQRAFYDEMWKKLVAKAGNVDMAIMVAGAVPPELVPDRDEILAFALEHLPWMGGNGGLSQGAPFDERWLDDPRRSYAASAADVVGWLPEGNEPVCIDDAEVATCTAQIELLGITLPNLTGWSSHDCTGAPHECPAGDDACTDAMATDPLPIPLRPYTDFLWQRNPFELGKGAGLEGGRQYAGSDYSEPYWNARRYDFLTAGEGQVLAWKDEGACAE